MCSITNTDTPRNKNNIRLAPTRLRRLIFYFALYAEQSSLRSVLIVMKQKGACNQGKEAFRAKIHAVGGNSAPSVTTEIVGVKGLYPLQIGTIFDR